jgi:flagellar assembly protein FliH
MSLSRVIKSGNYNDRSVTAFNFNNFQNRFEPGLHDVAEGFTPFIPGCEPGPMGDDKPDPVVDVPSAEMTVPDNGMIVISEEELESRIGEAFSKGVEEERKQADEDLAGICSALAEAVSIVSRLRERIVKESEEELLKLSLLVAKKIIRQEIKQDMQVMTQMVSETLKEFPEQHDIVVCLHPDDYRVISSNRELFLAGVGNDRHVTFKPDEALTSGGCVVESSTGMIDARIEAQLDEIYRSLIEEKSVLCDMSDANESLSRPDKELIT